ncbi:metallopeptidase TldD-related protein [Polyangium jinanense]|uniref:metallopeptidase TldD-related protein n=1 Tax=Polyangium jinanense TaxID=2829994 RepID=UPI003559A51B
MFGTTEAYLIEDGRLTAPLAPQNLIGNAIEMLGNVTMLGSDVFISDGIWTSGKQEPNGCAHREQSIVTRCRKPCRCLSCRRPLPAVSASMAKAEA